MRPPAPRLRDRSFVALMVSRRENDACAPISALVRDCEISLARTPTARYFTLVDDRLLVWKDAKLEGNQVARSAGRAGGWTPTRAGCSQVLQPLDASRRGECTLISKAMLLLPRASLAGHNTAYALDHRPISCHAPRRLSRSPPPRPTRVTVAARCAGAPPSRSAASTIGPS